MKWKESKADRGIEICVPPILDLLLLNNLKARFLNLLARVRVPRELTKEISLISAMSSESAQSHALAPSAQQQSGAFSPLLLTLSYDGVILSWPVRVFHLCWIVLDPSSRWQFRVVCYQQISTLITHITSERFEFFSPSLHHKRFRFEMKFSEIFPDVFYFATSNP